jgi:hypothetical protein
LYKFVPLETDDTFDARIMARVFAISTDASLTMKKWEG